MLFLQGVVCYILQMSGKGLTAIKRLMNEYKGK
jgi:hypothetical protein